MLIEEEERKDSYGGAPSIWVKPKRCSLQKIFDYLFKHYWGYKFVFIFDCTHDYWEEMDKEEPVYFMDEILEELINYAGADVVRAKLNEMENRKGPELCDVF